jgi:hypothetical protein
MNTPRRLYIEDYARRTAGRWYALDNYDDVEALESAIKDANHPEAEEFQICDAEGFPAGVIGTYTGHCEAWAWHEACQSTGDADAFDAFLQAFGPPYFGSAENALEIFERIGYDTADTEKDFAEEWAEASGLIPRDLAGDDVRTYIDWQRYWDAKLSYEYKAEKIGSVMYFFPANW